VNLPLNYAISMQPSHLDSGKCVVCVVKDLCWLSYFGGSFQNWFYECSPTSSLQAGHCWSIAK